MTCVAEIMPVK